MKSILLSNCAHIGDLILSTSVLPVLKAAYPGVKIGFLISSKALPVLEDHCLVDRIHIFDHPFLNRSSDSPKKKKKIANRTWHKAIEEINALQYELAVDLYYFYHGSAGALLAHTNIERRACFWGSSRRYYFNEHYFWDHPHLHMVQNHGNMLKNLGVEEKHLVQLSPTLMYRNPISEVPLSSDFKKKQYLVVHPGVGEPSRQWPSTFWKELAKHLSTLNIPLIFLGRGEKENRLILEILPKNVPCLNLCNQISWRQTFPIIQNARMLVGLESMSGHLAAALNTPALLMYSHWGNIPVWRPFNPCCHVIAAPPRPILSKTQRIIKKSEIDKITPEQVFRAASSLLNGSCPDTLIYNNPSL